MALGRGPRVILAAVIGCLIAASAGAAEWRSLKTAHFLLIGDASPGDLRDVALRFEQFRQAVSSAFPALLDDGRPGPPVIVLVFKDQRAYRPFQPRFGGQPVEVAGYYLGSPDIHYITMAADSRGPAFQTVYHEFAHLLLRRLPNLPVWFEEGVAEYFSTFDVSGNIANFGRPVLYHVTQLRGRRMPLSELFGVTHDSPVYNEKGTRRSLFYAQSWALMHYALVTNPERYRQLLRFRDRLYAGVSQAEAFQEAFGFGMPTLQEELDSYVRRLTMPFNRVPLDERVVSRVQDQPVKITDADAEAWLGDFLAHAGRMDEAREHLERALKAAPELPMAHASLGMMMVRQQNAADALPHLERAAASHSSNEFVHYYYGAALLESRDGTRPSPETVTKAIAALVRATELRAGFTEAQRALVYGYRLANEIEKARDLMRLVLADAPGDEQIILTLATTELQLGRVQEARKLVGPILARSTDAVVKQRARDVMAASVAVEQRQTLRQDLGLPAAASEPDQLRLPLGSQPAFRRVQPDETRTYGVFTEVACGSSGVVLHFSTPGKTALLLRALRFDAIEFVSFQSQPPKEIACGRQEPPQEVYVTWRAEDGSQGIVVAVELLPEGFVPVP